MSIQSEIDSTHRFLRRAKKFIEKVNESLNCEICYTHRKATTYTCTHKVCQTCYEKTKQCPFCRAPKPLILHDYIYQKDGLFGRWVRVSDHMRQNGIEPEAEINYTHAIFQVIFLYNDIKKEMIYCNKYTDFLNTVMPKLLVVNTALNYPIFTLHSDEDIFSDDLRIIRVIRGDRLDFRINRPVLHDMVRKLNRMKINCLTLLETIQDLNEFIQHGKELPS